MKARVIGIIVLAMLAAAGCTQRESSPRGSTATTGGQPPAAALATFVNRVWVVAESDHVAPGELRVFLSEGTLVMASSHGTPAFGAWTYQEGRLTITEEGLKYDVVILELTEDAFRIRIHGPGKPIEIRFAPAEQPLLPGDSQPAPLKR